MQQYASCACFLDCGRKLKKAHKEMENGHEGLKLGVESATCCLWGISAVLNHQEVISTKFYD